ncbi:hypothetical protein FZEAL_6071 [Fusarium zealandicum]|uniref:RING-type domain-containing protein n=1 Tax=Fusarium zealandicum TaxID=1053134 RepID=A0A8H4XJ83_9HYPO|nr:hypothetical protein FZEAL_6071 [Fusarium zealandicum]
MDPMDYMLHNHHRSSGPYDPVHSASSPWIPHPQNPSHYPWQAQNPGLPQPYSHHPLQPAPSSGSDPYQAGHHGGMLPPMLGLTQPRAFPENTLPGAVSPRPNGRHQTFRGGAMPPPIIAASAGAGDHIHDGAFANQIPGGRPLSFQPPVGMGMPLVAGGAGQEPNSLQRSPYHMPDPSANSFSQSTNNNNPSSHFPPSPLPPRTYLPTPPFFPAAPVPSRALRDVPSPTRPSPPSSGFRRSHPRQQRRSASSRVMSTDPGREDDDDMNRHLYLEQFLHSPGGSDSSESMDDTLVRHMQVVRGSVSTKMVASKRTLGSLQSVKIEDLAEADRNCVICYNDYGVQTPEGISEAPLRLPKCGHVFGDHCIKKWFEDSDSCPYCRDKLHSEPKQQHGASARAFMNMMRSQGIHVSPGMVAADDILVRAMAATSETGDRSAARQYPAAGRRSPPGDAGERQRRTRPRHNHTNTRESISLPGVHGRVVSVAVPLSHASSAGGAPLDWTSHSIQQVHNRDGLSPMARRRMWPGDDVRALSTASAAPQQNETSSPPLPEALSRLPPMYQRRGESLGLPGRPEPSLGETSSQNSPLPTFENPLQAQASSLLENSRNSENIPPFVAASSQQSQSGTFQSNRNRPW